MRILSILFPVVLMAQTPAPKPAAPAAPQRGTSAPAAPKTAAPATSTTTAPKPAAVPAAAAPKPAAPAVSTAIALTTDEQKEIYAVGLSIAESLAEFSLSPSELEIVKRAMTDSAAGKPAEKLEEWGPKIDDLLRSRADKAAEKEKAAAKAYVDKMAAMPGATKTATGLIYRETFPGLGASPKATDQVKVHYRGTLTDGKEFDSSYKRNQPATFPLNGVIKCWTEGVQLMKVGGKGTLVCPSDLAYGDGGRPGIPGGATLTFEIELLEIVQ
jgi:FKBP-type peptidyl-prolyl cis-trans isomerase FkpA